MIGFVKRQNEMQAKTHTTKNNTKEYTTHRNTQESDNM